jgi:amino acid transporter
MPIATERKASTNVRKLKISNVTQGTGLFLGSGKVLSIAGPAGALLAYTFMGLITLGVTYTTGEITTFMPRTGGFVRHATHFVEPALGAAVGWNFCTSGL